MPNKLILTTTVLVGLLLSQPALSSRVRFEFTQTGFPEGAVVTGSFEGEDLNNDGVLRQNIGNEITSFNMEFSGNSIVPKVTIEFIKNGKNNGLFTNLIYRLNGGPLADADEFDLKPSEGISITKKQTSTVVPVTYGVGGALGVPCGIGIDCAAVGPLTNSSPLTRAFSTGVVTVTQVPIEPTIPGAGNQVSGFVWLDNNADGLQSTGEPGFAQAIPGHRAPSVALYPEGSSEFIDITLLDENSNGHYVFKNVPTGEYYVCISNEFRILDLDVTAQNAGDDAIDSDFDASPCTYGVIVSAEQGAVRDLGLTGGSVNPGNGNQVSGFVWLDNNADGLQSVGEPGFAQTVPNFGAPSVALYPEGSTEFIDIAFLDESSNGLYQFNDVPAGNYYVCVSNEFRQLGLSVTIQNAGDDTIDSDFDTSPCSYGITVSAEHGVERDLGLRPLLDVRAFVGFNINRVTPSSSLNADISYNSISISAETLFSVRDRLIANGVSSEDALNTARQYVRTRAPVVEISGNGAFVRRISGGSGNVLYQPDIALTVSNVVVDEVNRGFARLTLTNATVNKKIYAGPGIDNLSLIFKNSTLCGVYFEEIIFPGVSANPCP